MQIIQGLTLEVIDADILSSSAYLINSNSSFHCAAQVDNVQDYKFKLSLALEDSGVVLFSSADLTLSAKVLELLKAAAENDETVTGIICVAEVFSQSGELLEAKSTAAVYVSVGKESNQMGTSTPEESF